MKNWISKLDEYLALLGKGILKNVGSVRADEAEKKASQEYTSYRKEQDKNYVSDFDREVKKIFSASVRVIDEGGAMGKKKRKTKTKYK